jgi:SAM-dependent methyltransferase
MSNINDTFFDGHYKTIWKTFIPEELTTRELDFMIPYFNLEKNSRVLDIMCGYGRHALGLGRKGIEVTAIDNLPAYIDEINITVQQEKLPVKAIRADILTFEPTEKFDLAICMGNSLQFFDRKDVIKILNNISTSLKPGGRLLINSWSIAEIVLNNFRERTWSQVGEMKFIVESRFRFSPSRMEIKSQILTPDGQVEEKESVDYIYSINEMESMLSAAGFVLTEIFSIPGKKKFTIGEPRAYLVGSL